MTINSPLSKWEIGLCFLVLVYGHYYSLTYLYSSQERLMENEDKLNYDYLMPGYQIIGRMQDFTDIEWPIWRHCLKKTLFFSMIHFMISEFLRQFHYEIIPQFNIIFSVLYIQLFLGFIPLILFLAIPIMFYILCETNIRSKAPLWLLGIAILCSMNFIKENDTMTEILLQLEAVEEDILLVLITLSWVVLRCITTCWEYFDDKEHGKPFKLPLFTALLAHSLYFPTLFTGPILLYKQYEDSLDPKKRTIPLKRRLNHLYKNLLVFVIYFGLIELSLHYMHFYAMQTSLKLMKQLPSFALYGGGLWMGLHFHIKYVVTYGIATVFARADHIDAPPTPRCVARVHVYSDMWKYFDVGLYKFMVKYLYKPMLMRFNKAGDTYFMKLGKQIFTSFLTFVFVYLWHGTTENIMVWTILNFFGIVIEKIAQEISKTNVYLNFRLKILRTEQMHVRFKAALCVPLLIMSTLSNFYLFTNHVIGNLFVYTFITDTMMNKLIIFVILYCWATFSMSISNVPSRLDCKLL